MHKPPHPRWTGALALAAGASLALAPTALAHSGSSGHGSEHDDHGHHGRGDDHGRGDHDGRNDDHVRDRHAERTVGRFAQRDLVADADGAAELTDPALVNAWGLSFGPATPAWVSNFASANSTLYAGGVNGSPVTKTPLTVTIPGGTPTGQVFNPTTEFVVRSGDAAAPSRFIFATARGTIAGWSSTVPAAGSTEAQTAVTTPTAEYTGLAIAGSQLYAADFHNARVDVFDGSFAPIDRPGAFRDARIPRGYAPFGIETVGDRVVVTYAKQDAARQLDVPGPGHGFVDVYSTSGQLLKRLAARGPLDSPWGVAQAPQSFGAARDALLIGNFGDGRISAYSPRGRFLGQLAGDHRRAIEIPGLWALKFGNGVIGTPDSLLFTAGPAQGRHGLFGELNAAQTQAPAPTAPTTPSAPSMPGGY
ncbi:TIGR03118 family protein [Conexibacter sp. CPCC 206217]|uniref:TIGR03118 family protein n=1 Tax=Conexibacter sp. CPCC 206217 TaxID=3064574 RepID=UPI00271C5524|nr:TIGR03118 family protein [Conexibacter sp. CPCC 206217]MDO8211187.1 TIGR03118 family protein [Conexibacter sp. CPCC 206217]